jgi:prepilin-type N-terminal cleavage/methylation domain-containing protein
MQPTVQRFQPRRVEMKDQGGFTLIELLIVVTILGILAAIVVFGVSNLTTSSAQSACTSDYKSTEIALETYKDEMRSYPNSNQDGNAALPYTDNGKAADNAAAAGGELLVASSVTPNIGSPGMGPWLKESPTNPGHYTISVANDGTGTITVLNGSGHQSSCSAVS